MMHYLSTKLLIVAALAALLLSACQPVQPETAQQVALQLVSHVAAGMAEQDVYVAKSEGAGEVFRITGDEVDAYMDAPVYASQEAIAHDLFGLSDNPVGPYPQRCPWALPCGTGWPPAQPAPTPCKAKRRPSI
ncbi:MAG: hypothetical protein R3E79_35295 [Caldilineaceae bacterium]